MNDIEPIIDDYDELDAELRSLLLAAPPAGLTTNPVGAVAKRVADNRRKGFVQRVAVAAVCIALVGVAALLFRSDEDTTAPGVGLAEQPPTVPPTTPLPLDTTPPTTAISAATPDGRVPGAVYLNAGPLSPRTGAALLDLGDQLLVWGGDYEGRAPDAVRGPQVDGAIYDWATDEWTMMAPSPLTSTPDGETLGVWTGSEALYWSTEGGAAYNPATDTWRELEGEPDVMRTAYWAGTDVVDLWNSRRYDPAKGTTVVFDSFPLSLSYPSDAAFVWADGRGYILEIESDGTRVLGAVFDPETDRWTELPEFDTGRPLGGWEPDAAWDGTDIYLTHSDARTPLFAFDPATQTWRFEGDLDVNSGESYVSLIATEEGVAATERESAVRLGDEPWQQHGFLPLRYAIARADGTVVSFAATNLDGTNELIAFRLSDLSTGPLLKEPPSFEITVVMDREVPFYGARHMGIQLENPSATTVTTTGGDDVTLAMAGDHGAPYHVLPLGGTGNLTRESIAEIVRRLCQNHVARGGQCRAIGETFLVGETTVTYLDLLEDVATGTLSQTARTVVDLPLGWRLVTTDGPDVLFDYFDPSQVGVNETGFLEFPIDSDNGPADLLIESNSPLFGGRRAFVRVQPCDEPVLIQGEEPFHASCADDVWIYTDSRNWVSLADELQATLGS